MDQERRTTLQLVLFIFLIFVHVRVQNTNRKMANLLPGNLHIELIYQSMNSSVKRRHQSAYLIDEYVTSEALNEKLSRLEHAKIQKTLPQKFHASTFNFDEATSIRLDSTEFAIQQSSLKFNGSDGSRGWIRRTRGTFISNFQHLDIHKFACCQMPPNFIPLWISVNLSWS